MAVCWTGSEPPPTRATHRHRGALDGYVDSSNDMVKIYDGPAHALPSLPGTRHVHVNRSVLPSARLLGDAEKPTGWSARHAFRSSISRALATELAIHPARTHGKHSVCVECLDFNVRSFVSQSTALWCTIRHPRRHTEHPVPTPHLLLKETLQPPADPIPLSHTCHLRSPLFPPVYLYHPPHRCGLA